MKDLDSNRDRIVSPLIFVDPTVPGRLSLWVTRRVSLWRINISASLENLHFPVGPLVYLTFWTHVAGPVSRTSSAVLRKGVPSRDSKTGGRERRSLRSSEPDYTPFPFVPLLLRPSFSSRHCSISLPSWRTLFVSFSRVFVGKLKWAQITSPAPWRWTP